MDVSPIVARLRAQCSGQFVDIGASADADAVLDAVARTPAVYAIPLAELAEDSPLIGVHRQRCEQVFGVVIVVANVRDAVGSAAAAELQSKRLAVRNALLGWVPDATNGEPVVFRSGAILMFRDQRLWWRDVFAVRAYLTAA